MDMINVGDKGTNVRYIILVQNRRQYYFMVLKSFCTQFFICVPLIVIIFLILCITVWDDKDPDVLSSSGSG